MSYFILKKKLKEKKENISVDFMSISWPIVPAGSTEQLYFLCCPMN